MRIEHNDAFTEITAVQVLIRRNVIKAIYEECDKFNADETGGRLLGFLTANEEALTIDVAGLIDSGPNARRTPVSFFQDGDHQATIFRKIEESFPEIEHLGNWHSHHVNGLSQLSSGDINTYSKTVNHKNHNTDIFYALLITEKHNHGYKMKHYLFRRNDPTVYQIPDHMVRITADPMIRLEPQHETPNVPKLADVQATVRINDKTIISTIYPLIRPYQSKDSGIFYWKGQLELISGRFDVVVAEEITRGKPIYSIVMRDADRDSFAGSKTIKNLTFNSASEALRKLETALNKELYERQKKPGA